MAWPRAQWHHGATVGFGSAIVRFPDDGLPVAILANRDDLDLQSLALQIAGARLGGRPDP
jgi:CubicO group peptidase (beta-lactamase class C family)